METFTVQVAGDATSHAIHVCKNAKLKDIKQCIEHATGIPKHHQKLKVDRNLKSISITEKLPISDSLCIRAARKDCYLLLSFRYWALMQFTRCIMVYWLQ